MTWWKWSTTAASNANADSTINWSEGQAPSSINDSSRAEMAGNAKYFLDQDGSITSSGTSTAYTVTTNGVFDSLAHLANRSFTFVPHATNGATVTLNCDGLGAKPLRAASGVELQAGVLIQGTPYRVFYNNSDAAFYLHSIPGNLPYAVPIGGLVPYTGTTAPTANYALTYGQAVSRSTYATLFALVGTTFGTGDGSTTFNLPDLRGRAIFGLDNMGGSAASRVTTAGSSIDGTTLGAAGGAQNVTVAQANLPAATLATTITDPGHSHTVATTSMQSGSGGSPLFNGPGIAATGTATTGITASTALGGSGTALNKMPPAIVLPYILRVI